MVTYSILLSIVFFVGCLISPRWLWWNLSAWAYRDPEANEPSESAYATGRALLLVLAIVCLLVAVSQCSADKRAAERTDARPDMPVRTDDEIRKKADPYPEDLVAKGVARVLSLEPGTGHASGYIIGYDYADRAASAVTILYYLSPCGRLHSAWAEEKSPYDYRVKIRLVEETRNGQKFTKKCRGKEWKNRSFVVQSTTIALTRPLDNRWVVLYDGGRVHPK
ncbi:hypothetical protein ACFPOI_00935 [Nonomuraea angiospora]|uniref:DUF6199 domain-containing protein n=1 Tax=Nonomuraea angiospora TaxID=46172 RepID=A0ABR9M233_9ACTN|nr:hypothetical protein [Nonomuraea angiospora]MBE1586969.1 hypothetical protein [Nonomuraea angiospora]